MEPPKKGGKASRPEKVQGGRGRLDDIMDCPVCLTAFDDVVQRPRTLPCGHTLCTPCVNRLIDQNQVLCPTCRKAHTVPESGWFGVTYVIEELIRSRREAALVSPTPGPGQRSPAGLSKAVRSMLQQQEDNVLAAIRSCQEVLGQLDHYHTKLAGWNDQQRELNDRLLALVEQNNSASLLVRQEVAQVCAKRQQIHQTDQQLQGVLQMLRTVTTRQEAIDTIEDVEHHTVEERQRTEECRAVFPNRNTVTAIRKAIVTTVAAVTAAETTECVPAGATGDQTDTADPTFTITEKLQSLLAPPLEVKDLLTLTQPAKNLLQAGLVFAIHKIEGRSRYSRITLEGDRSFLHSMQDLTVPPGAAILQIHKLVPASPPCLVFLDLSWPGSTLYRVLINLKRNTPMGRQFIFMCTGQRGHSYINTCLHGLWYKGKTGESVLGGDYEMKNGSGGAPLLPHLNKGKYWKSGMSGTVFRVRRGEDKFDCNTQFGIITWDCPDGFQENSVFGDVVEGLEGVVAAAQHRRIEEVTVVDCGVVL